MNGVETIRFDYSKKKVDIVGTDSDKEFHWTVPLSPEKKGSFKKESRS